MGKGNRERERRRAEAFMPPELKQEMKSRIATLAVKRVDVITQARRERKEKIASANAVADKAAAEAYAEFDKNRNQIVDEFNRRAVAARGGKDGDVQLVS